MSMEVFIWLVLTMVVNPGGAVPHRDGKGRSGTARLPGRYSLVPSGAERVAGQYPRSELGF
jgi:hypothetical protein